MSERNLHRPRSTSSIERLLIIKDQHQQDSCYEALTCEDKILLSQLIHESQQLPKNISAKAALIYLNHFLQEYASSTEQIHRVSIALKASLLQESVQHKSGDVQNLASQLQSSQELHSYLNNYLASIFSFYQVIEKIKNNPIDAYFLYSMADKENWQAQIIGKFIDIPRFEHTPVGESLDWIYTARKDLIYSFETTLETLEVSALEKRKHIHLLKAQLQKQFEDAESAIISAELTILGAANSYQKSYQAILSATIIAATWGTAGPLMFSLNSSGLFLAADSAIDLSESLIDAHGLGGSGDFFCSFARNNRENYGIENVFINGAIGGAIGFVATGLLSTLLRSSSQWKTAAASVAAGGALIYGADAIVLKPIEQIKQLQLERDNKNIEQPLDQCLSLAQKKIKSGIAINSTALIMSLKGIGEAQFFHSPKVPTNIKRPSQSNISGPESKGAKVIREKKRVRKSPPQYLLKDRIFPGGKISPRPLIKKLYSQQTKQSIIYLKKYLDEIPLWEVRSFDSLNFPNHTNNKFLVRMFNETRERFSDPDFVVYHLREILAQYEHYRGYRLGERGAPSDFNTSWRGFMNYIGQKEGLESVILENRFYGQQEFRQQVGKKLLFDVAFSGKRHGETTHAIQVLFIYRHFKDQKVPDELIDDYFDLLRNADFDLWNRLFDGFGNNFASPEAVSTLFEELKFYHTAEIGL